MPFERLKVELPLELVGIVTGETVLFDDRLHQVFEDHEVFGPGDLYRLLHFPPQPTQH